MSKKIFLSAGHGGVNPDNNIVDPGNCHNGLKEADVVLQIVKEVQRLLKSEGFPDNDVKVGKRNWNLSIVTNQANNCLDADDKDNIFVEIHCNAAESPLALGYETFYNTGSTNGKQLAKNINDDMIKSISGFYSELDRKKIDRGIQDEGFWVLSYTNNPAVLVECGFLSSPIDSALLKKTEFITRISKGIVSGILNYWGIGENASTAVKTEIVKDTSSPSATVAPNAQEQVLSFVVELKAPDGYSLSDVKISTDMNTAKITLRRK